MKIPERVLALLNCFWTFIAPSISKHHDADRNPVASSEVERASFNSFSLAVLQPVEEENSFDVNLNGKCHYDCEDGAEEGNIPDGRGLPSNSNEEKKKNSRISFRLSDRFFGRLFSNVSNQNLAHHHNHHHHHRMKPKQSSSSHHRTNHHQHLHHHQNRQQHLDDQQKHSQKWNENLGKGSKKIRRHGKNIAFHGHHHHFSQELQQQELKDLLKEPSFDESSPSFVTAQLGSSAFLSCRIHDLEDKSVSWIRNRDAHILTVDRYTFIADSRFVSWFDAESETWTLQVKFIEKDDAGRYECQVSTEPKKSHFVTLAVIAPRVEIPGGSELHVRSGSDVMLKCVISRALTPPPHVFWYHEERRVLDGSLGGLVHQAPLAKVSKDSSVASLTIKNAKQKHAGNYTCAPAGLSTTASVVLHVLNGEHPAAMQHGSNAASNNGKVTLQLLHFILPILSFKFICHKYL